MIEEQTRVRPPILSGAIAAVGATAVAVGSFLDWFRVQVNLTKLGLASRTVTSRGVDGSDGKITLAAGLVVVLAVVLTWIWTARGGRVFLASVTILAGLLAAGLAGFDAATARDRFIDAQAGARAKASGISVEQAKVPYRLLFRQGIFRITLPPGIYFVIGGGAVAALGGMAALVSAPEGTEGGEG